MPEFLTPHRKMCSATAGSGAILKWRQRPIGGTPMYKTINGGYGNSNDANNIHFKMTSNPL